MINPEKLKRIDEAVMGLTSEEMIWLSGYFAGKSGSNAQNKHEESVIKTSVQGKLTIAYGTESGNAKRIATDFAARIKKKGIQTRLVNLEQYRLPDLQKEDYFLTIVSTQGEGDPPEGAKKFFNHIHNQDFRLDHIKYSVLALGDTSYPLFCKAGEDVDNQLARLGAKRIAPLQKCDTDYTGTSEQWLERVLQNFGSPGPKAVSIEIPVVPSKKLYRASVLSNIILNDRGSAREVHHIEFEVPDIQYKPGDSLGFLPKNPEKSVKELIEILNLEPDQKIVYKDELYQAKELLSKKVSVHHLPERIVKKYASMTGHDIPNMRICLQDLLKIYPPAPAINAKELLGILETLTPRLYSISSSPEAHSGEVHLTVALNMFDRNGIKQFGLCSSLLSQLAAGDELDFYIHSNNQFRLPADDIDIIMIGPGTGIAPFRSFIAQREATGASGRNWLFFGGQHFVSDFLYQTELLSWLDTGVLTKLDVAFSRDQEEKLYVQHKMIRQAKSLYDWIEGGAIVYICGAKAPMAEDVELALLEVFIQGGGMSKEEAEEKLYALKDSGRLLKDVY